MAILSTLSSLRERQKHRRTTMAEMAGWQEKSV